MDYQKIIKDAYNIYSIKSDKFKTNKIRIVFYDNISKDNITKYNVLSSLLVHSCEEYNTFRKLSQKIEELYNIGLISSIKRRGDTIMLTIELSFLESTYMEPNTIEKIIYFFLNLIQKPNIKNSVFDKSAFDVVFEKIKAEIMSLKENPNRYALSKLLCSMDSDSHTSLQINGYLDDLKVLTPKEMVIFYHNMLNKANCNIFVLSNKDEEKILKEIEKCFELKSIKREKNSFFIDNKTRSKVQIIKEKFPVSQAVLMVGCNLIDLTEEEQKITMNIYNFILGGGSLSSKLYTSLRHDNSLCYYTYSTYARYDNQIYISAGINQEKFSLANKLVKKVLKEMTENITDEELTTAKNNYVTIINKQLESQSSILNNCENQVLNDDNDFDTQLKKYNSVTKEQIKKLAKKVKINTVYLLSDGE